MAMTLRLPAELDARLEALARKRGTSKHALVVESTRILVDLEVKTDLAVEIASDVRTRYAELLRRLEDA
ncbi:MAG: CopG family transcriptional regulator [Microbacterium sp.]|uniref:ribbon-helix-helix protein, CopG family n=1 Tax=Microbacterium sp. TaxID=51671 RepID=UPI0039E5E3C8